MKNETKTFAKGLINAFLITALIWGLVVCSIITASGQSCKAKAHTYSEINGIHYCQVHDNGTEAYKLEVMIIKPVQDYSDWDIITEQTRYGVKKYYRKFIETNGYVTQKRVPIKEKRTAKNKPSNY